MADDKTTDAVVKHKYRPSIGIVLLAGLLALPAYFSMGLLHIEPNPLIEPVQVAPAMALMGAIFFALLWRYYLKRARDGFVFGIIVAMLYIFVLAFFEEIEYQNTSAQEYSSQSPNDESLTEMFTEVWESHEATRIYRLMAKEYPEIKSRYFDLVQSYEAVGASREDLLRDFGRFGQEVVAAYIQKYLARSQDSELIAYFRLYVEVADELLSAPGDSCYTWMFGGDGDMPSISDANGDKMYVATQQVIESAIRYPATSLGAYRSQEYLDNLFRQYIAQGEDPELLDLELSDPLAADTVSKRRRACHAYRNLNRVALSMGPEDAANTIRALYSEQ